MQDQPYHPGTPPTEPAQYQDVWQYDYQQEQDDPTVRPNYMPPYMDTPPPPPLDSMEQEYPRKNKLVIVCGSAAAVIFLVSIFLMTASAIGAITRNTVSTHTEIPTSSRVHGLEVPPIWTATPSPTRTLPATPTTVVVPVRPPVQITPTSAQPTVQPTTRPTVAPTPRPTKVPTPTPTKQPTPTPTSTPLPTNTPTPAPTATPIPTSTPAPTPTVQPTVTASP